MRADELRQKYLNFFKKRGHAVISSASLIPENDPSVLFTTAGMHPLVPYLMGEKHPSGNKLTSIQKCIRTGDIEEVGNETHHTFFEMLGNWSLGEYFKKEAIEMSLEFLTNELKLKKEKLAFSVFEGDKDAPFDKGAFEIWQSLGISEKRIKKLPKKDNWWGPVGETGPCGPDTEMFYWSDLEVESPSEFNPSDKRWVEIWNDVFMEFNKIKIANKITTGGRLYSSSLDENILEKDKKFIEILYKFEPLKQKNVDTGMGLERTLAVINRFDDNYKTELFLPIIEKIEKLSGKKYDENKKEMRIIADHIKAGVMILGDERGIIPSNTGHGYVLRRLIRRAVRYAKILGIEKNFTADLFEPIIKIYKDIYPEIKKNQDFINRELEAEENKFRKTLEQGEKLFSKMSESKNISGKDAFLLFSTYGFPFELTQELAQEKSFSINIEEFNEEMRKHQDLSRTSSIGMFKGGLADAGEETKKLHTTAHLMLQAMRIILGNHIEQKGSNITSERLRFDFSHPQKLSDEEKEKIEKIVNEQIEKKLPVWFEEMSLDEAKKIGATGVFEHKYGDRVKVYFIGKENDNFSREICGGPHIENTSELGSFKILKEESVSAGVRRIKAVLE
ncbi:MAG: alanine--tRNA ligase [Candidatus Paceibacterota bacterium]